MSFIWNKPFKPSHKGKWVLMNFASKWYVESRKLQKRTALGIGGFDTVIEYSMADLDDNFKEKNKEHFKHSRGGGYWVWKPYLILKTLQTLGPDDILMYCDSGASFVSSIKPYIDNFTGSFMLFQLSNEYMNKWTKGDIFQRLGCLNDKTITESKQCIGTYSLWKRNEESISFLKKWLELCEDFHLISDEPSITPNLPEFSENRHDQALLSCLALSSRNIYNIQIEVDPSNAGKDRKYYLTEIINSHRLRG